MPIWDISLVKLFNPSFVRSPPQLARTSRFKNSSNPTWFFPSRTSTKWISLNLIFLFSPNSRKVGTDNVFSSPAIIWSEVAHAKMNCVLRSSLNSAISFYSTSLNFFISSKILVSLCIALVTCLLVFCRFRRAVDLYPGAYVFWRCICTLSVVYWFSADWRAWRELGLYSYGVVLLGVSLFDCEYLEALFFRLLVCSIHICLISPVLSKVSLNFFL